MTQDRPRGREAQRLQTRQRVLDAAVAEFKETGMAEADVGAIVESAGVARDTFYFHFPTKEHVLLELQAREEAGIAQQPTRFLAEPRDLPTALSKTIQLVAAMEGRLGSLLFKDLLAVHFTDQTADRRVDGTSRHRAGRADIGERARRG